MLWPEAQMSMQLESLRGPQATGPCLQHQADMAPEVCALPLGSQSHPVVWGVSAGHEGLAW